MIRRRNALGRFSQRGKKWTVDEIKWKTFKSKTQAMEAIKQPVKIEEEEFEEFETEEWEANADY